MLPLSLTKQFFICKNFVDIHSDVSQDTLSPFILKCCIPRSGIPFPCPLRQQAQNFLSQSRQQ